MDMIVRVSERGTFKRCRRKWDYGSPNRQNLTSAGTPVYLTFGTMIHSTLEAWTADLDADPVKLFMVEAWKATEEMKKRYRRVVGTDPSEEEIGLLYDHVEMGASMIAAYQQRWGSPLPQGYHKVELEQTFLIDVPGTEHQLQGTLDGLMMDDEGNFFILERKTYGARPRLDILNHNDQFLAYIWAVQQLQDTKAKVGILYDGLWKRKLEGKRKLEDMNVRHLLWRPQGEIDEFGRLLTLEVNDMANDPAIYVNRQWMGCFDCPFERLCTAQSSNKDYEYTKNTFYAPNTEGLEEEEIDTAGNE